jgi:hypothetical protein
VDGQLKQAVTARPAARCYQVSRRNTEIFETPLPVLLLG